MGDLARREIEDVYVGVPDESVNLTFKHLARLNTQPLKSTPINTQKSCNNDNYSKLPSFDFNPTQDKHHVNVVQNKFMTSPMSGMSSMSTTASPFQTGRRRPGIPHSNICTICTTYIYIFRHRCLVCGRVYCRQCVQVGMGDMAEGRKCVDCLGRRFSSRYIQVAGQIGCCMSYPSKVKQQELKWAEKGPRITRRNKRSPAQMTPTMAHSSGSTPSFVINSPYSPYTQTPHYSLPF